MKRSIIIIFVILSVVAFDQISKYVVRQKLEYNTQINVIDENVILTKVENSGAFLGLGDSLPRFWYKILMIYLPLAAIGYGIMYILKIKEMSKWLTIGISLIIGGGLGNIIDRILYGSVTDFLYFDFVLFHTGIVNLADMAVTLGFFIILFDQYLPTLKRATNPPYIKKNDFVS